jgi:translocation and assembly module TamA
LSVAIDSGPEFFFGDLEISGLERFPESVVRANNPIRPGTPYSERALADFQATLQGTGYFTSVFVSMANEPEHAQRAPIRVQVVENTLKRLSMGAGYSTDTGFSVLGRYDGTVFDIPGWRAHATLELSQREQSVNSEVTLPPIARNFVPKFGARVSREDVEGQTTVSYVLGTRLVRTTRENELAFSLQWYKDRKETAVLTDRLTSFPLNASTTWRKVDDLLYPQRGYSLNLQGGGAVEETFSDQRFLRLYAKGNYFHPLGDAQTLIVRAEVGGVKASGRAGIPDDFLFRTGGSQSVRGYSFGSIGIPQADAIVRGRYITVGSVEFRHRVVENWWAAVFYDTGGVADSFSAIDRVNGYGAGVRWRSPLGPINFDVAYGEADNKVRLHFSVGYAF